MKQISISLLFIAAFSCKSDKTLVRVNGRELEHSQITIHGLDSAFKIKDFQVRPQASKGSGSLFSPKGAVQFKPEIQTWRLGEAIEYHVDFLIRIDSNHIKRGLYPELHKVSIIRQVDHRDPDSTGNDSIFLIPCFKYTQERKSFQTEYQVQVRLSHYSSSRNTNVVFTLAEHSVLIKTQFCKALAPGG